MSTGVQNHISSNWRLSTFLTCHKYEYLLSAITADKIVLATGPAVLATCPRFGLFKQMKETLCLFYLWDIKTLTNIKSMKILLLIKLKHGFPAWASLRFSWSRILLPLFFFSNKKCFYTIGVHYVLPKVWHYTIAFKKAIHKYSIMKYMVESPDQAYQATMACILN